MKLTERQSELLRAAAPYSHPGGVLMVTPLFKGGWPSRFWRNFDQLERRGLLELRTSGRYIITDGGRSALGQTSPPWRV